MNPQKLIFLDITPQTEQYLIDKMSEGYAIQHVCNLQPSLNKLLIVYAEPFTEPQI